MGREFFVSKYLTLRPHFGMRLDWIRQTNRGYYQNQTNSSQINFDKKDQWYGIGLAGGVDSQWDLGKGWSLFGNIAGAILYGLHNMDIDETNSPAQSNSAGGVYADVDESYRISHPILDVQGGIRWDNMFDHDRLHLGVQIGWEHHIYFSQNQFPVFPDASNPGLMVSNQGDLALQGWTFSARFDF